MIKSARRIDAEPITQRKNSDVIGSVFTFSVIPSVEEKENATG